MSTCTICGGSGIQRVTSQRFRTCQACLGTGLITAATQSAPLNQLTTVDPPVARLESVPQPVS